jgi:hypothetical protein
MNDFILKIEEFNVDNIDNITKYLSGYYKTISMLYLKILGLPVLNGLILNSLNEDFKNKIQQFCNINGFNSLLLRHDKKNEDPNYPRGGYLFNVANVDDELKKYLIDNRIVILLEPISPYDDLYSINIFIDRNSDKFILEIVGPGFDASDLQRGDITPHEGIEIYKTSSEFDFQHIKRLYIINDYDYKNSVNKRLIKIGKRQLIKKNIKTDLFDEEKLIDMGIDYLKVHNKNLLLQNLDHYQQIEFKYLKKIYHYIKDFPEILNGFNLINSKCDYCVLSTGIFINNRINFWDIVWPDLKYTLY